MKRVFTIVFALALVVSVGLVRASPALAAGTIHVPGDYPTIQQAVDAASPGDTVTVAAGIYTAFQAIGKNNIHIIGAEGAIVATTNLYTALPIVGKAWVFAAVYNSTNINIEGINFDGAGVTGKPVAVGIAYVDSTGRIANLIVENVIATELGAGVAIIGDVGTSNVEIVGTTISSNDNAGIYVCGGSNLEAQLSNIVGNTECGLLNDGGGMVDATYNWWGHARGPLHQSNPLGGGNAVVGEVDFKPWLEAQIVAETVENAIVDAIEEADTEVVVEGKATVIIAEYASNPHPSSSVYGAAAALDVMALSDEFEELDIFRDVRVIRFEHGTSVEIRLYYTDDQARRFDEDSLRPFWWNGDGWAPCSPEAASGVNTTDTTVDTIEYDGYMWAEITDTTTPSLAALNGTPWGGYGHPSEAPQPLCFVASAVYGTDTAQELDILRAFRDEVLLPNTLGANFAYLYYRTSPPIASFISRHKVLRITVKVAFLDPIVKILNWTHDLWST